VGAFEVLWQATFAFWVEEILALRGHVDKAAQIIFQIEKLIHLVSFGHWLDDAWKIDGIPLFCRA
jgi:hypothetical protein